MIDLKQFTQDAIRTESAKPELKINHDFLINTLRAHIATGNILDQIKKHMYYGSAYDLEKYGKTLTEQLDDAYEALFELNDLVADPNSMPEESLPTVNPRLAHALIGTATEATELCEALETYIEEGKLDMVNVAEEFFDCNWYQSIFFDESELDWEQTFTNGINKLKARYPDKFNQLDAEIRDLTNEREILETNIKQSC